MLTLSALERAVLIAFAEHYAPYSAVLRLQIASVRVSARRNTGAGFYTDFLVSDVPEVAAPSPLGPVSAGIEGVEHGMGFLLWLREGVIHSLEGYTYDDDLTGMNLVKLRFSDVTRELPSGRGW